MPHKCYEHIHEQILLLLRLVIDFKLHRMNKSSSGQPIIFNLLFELKRSANTNDQLLTSSDASLRKIERISSLRIVFTFFITDLFFC